MKDVGKLISAVILCQLAGIAGTSFTISAIPTWYATLTKPFFTPPNWLFGPVWTVLYFLMGVSLFLVWRKKVRGKQEKKKQFAFRLFGLQLAANFLWTMLFFGLHSPLLGLIDLVLLIVLIVLTYRAFYQLSKVAAYLLIPYLLWVSFATILNAALFSLN